LTTVYCNKFEEYFGHCPLLCLLKDIGLSGLLQVGTELGILVGWDYQSHSLSLELSG